MSNYRTKPETKINSNKKIYEGTNQIYDELKDKIKNNNVVVFDCYPGVNENIVEDLAKRFNPTYLYNSRNFFKDDIQINFQLKYHITDDRVFGKMCFGEFIDLVNIELLNKVKEDLNCAGLKIIYGVGASLIDKYDFLVYFDVTRWEIQLRYRKGLENFKQNNADEDNLRKFKRGYFIEWRLADKHKTKLFNKFNYYVDCNNNDKLKMISNSLFKECLIQNIKQPFRLVPYFDAAPWGGQWMKEKFGLKDNGSNYGWSFDGVPEENSLIFNINGKTIEMPAMNLTLYFPKELLGKKVYARFGAEFPIRFDYLDTMQGGNLSLQVHPITEYIKKEFGMAYTQDESYYILDASEDSSVFLGLKEDTNFEEFISNLKQAQETGEFDALKYINQIPAKKHDHFLIPAGTIHCSGKNTVVLEISATPYIFTFKLWDWGRLGLDGKPRPVHINHGEKVIDQSRRTKWVYDNCVSQFKKINDKEEHTGLHELEFIETRRFTFNDEVLVDNHESVNMLNLVEGERVVVSSVDNSFDDYEVFYGETFVVPETIKKYKLIADGEVKVLQAYVRV